MFGNYVAKRLEYSSVWKYWAIRTGVVIGGAVIGWFAGTALLKMLTKYVLANPAVASKLPKIALWFMGMGGASGQIANDLFSKYGSHMFNPKHGLGDLISMLGKRGVFNKAFQIVSSKISQAQNGSNQIYAVINGIKVTIRFWFKDGQFGSFNIIGGWIERIIGKLLK